MIRHRVRPISGNVVSIPFLRMRKPHIAIRFRFSCALRRLTARLRKTVRRLTAVLLALALSVTLTGCWGKQELPDLFIITGVALDTAKEPDQITVSLQAAKAQASSPGGGSSGGKSSEKSSILFSSTQSTMAEAIDDINRSASRQVFIHHNQVILFGIDLAREGVYNHIDMFLRDEESRMEVPIMVMEGLASDALSIEMEQDKISGLYLSSVLNDLNSISEEYVARLLDFSSRLLDGTTSPVATLLAAVKKGDKTTLQITGMAVFKGGIYAGKLSNQETLGYIWAMDKVTNSSVSAQSDQGKAAFAISTLSCKPVITLKADGGVKVSLKVNATLKLDEMEGFLGVDSRDLLVYLSNLAGDAIEEQILSTFEIARAMGTDIYGYGAAIHRKYPQEWKSMKDNWEAYFKGIEFSVSIKTSMPDVGKVVQSLEMEEKK